MPTRRWNGHTGVVLDSVGGFDVIDCGQCRFKHIVPIPTPVEMEHVYRHEYYAIVLEFRTNSFDERIELFHSSDFKE